jgi:hypothetical protein
MILISLLFVALNVDRVIRFELMVEMHLENIRIAAKAFTLVVHFIPNRKVGVRPVIRGKRRPVRGQCSVGSRGNKKSVRRNAQQSTKNIPGCPKILWWRSLPS